MSERAPGHPFEWEHPWPFRPPTPETAPEMFTSVAGPGFDVSLVAHAWVSRKAFNRGLPQGMNALTSKAVRAVLYTDELNRYRKLVSVIGLDGWALVKTAIMFWR